MPEIARSPLRMDCDGLDVTHPIDRVPPKRFPYLTNARVVEEGRLDGRPGYTTYEPQSAHSMRRLNDPDGIYNASGYVNVVGSGTDLYAGPQGTLNLVASGFSGDPLSLINFRPDQSPTAWSYVYDRTKMVKVRSDRKVNTIGIAPPPPILDADYGVPAWVEIDYGQSVAGWAGSGSAGAPTLVNRLAAVAPVVGFFHYNSGTTGWCCIFPSQTLAGQDWSGPRMQVVIDAGGAHEEIVVVREVHPAGVNTTIAGIRYDSGTTGKCTIVLTAQPSNPVFLTRNSLIVLNAAETVRVTSVSLSPDGSTYSFRCSTAGTFAAGNSAVTQVSWYVYTAKAHADGETITGSYVQSVNGTAGASVATLTKSRPINAAVAFGRPISLSQDWMHISLYVTQPQNTSYIQFRLNLSATDYLEATITPDTLATGWNEVLLPLAQFQRFGTQPGQTIASIASIQIIAAMNNVGTIGFDWWYLFGTYGPTILPNDPAGIVYATRVRDPETGTASVPCPPTRHELFPLREQIVIQPAVVAAGIDFRLDVYRQGGSLSTLTYVATSTPSGVSTAFPVFDALPDAEVAGNPAADFTLIQPFPIQDVQWSGIVDAIGTTVKWISGDQFDLNLLSGQVITIGQTAFQVRGQPGSTTQLELFASAGVQIGAVFQVASPTMAAQPLPLSFLLEGPFLPVVLSLGDPINPGTLYYSNAGNPDGASDANTIEVAPPSEPLISGAAWNGIVIVGSRDNIYVSRYSYLQTLGIPGQTTFQFNKIPSPSGMWSRWACCAGPDGVYFLGRDGIYRATDQGVVNVTDPTLYPMFPHDGEPAKLSYGMLPVDMTALTSLRLNCADEDVYFDYAAVDL